MYEKEITRVRTAILKGLLDSSKNLLHAKIRANRPIAVFRNNQIQVVPARNL